MKIIIGKPTLENGILSADITYDGMTKKLYYRMDMAIEPYAVTDRVDGFLVSALPLAMIRSGKLGGAEIICEAPVSRRLYHQLVNSYIPTLSRNVSYYGLVKITAELIDEPIQSSGAVATGISGGVDSSYSVAKYADKSLGKYQLTHGVYFNIGIYGGYDSVAEKLLENRAKQICNECDLTYVCIESNICRELYHKAYAPVVHHVFMGAILSFQKLFSIYYYSSTVGAEDFYFSEKDAAYYDWLNIMCFSTDATLFYSSGMETTRIDKVRFIAEYPFTYNNLSVCLSEAQGKGNCGRCAKCTRTMTELDAIGALERYGNVFDIAAYRADPDYHWGYVLLKAWGGDIFSKETINAYRRSGRTIPGSAYRAAMGKWAKRGFTTENRQREKVEELI